MGASCPNEGSGDGLEHDDVCPLFEGGATLEWIKSPRLANALPYGGRRSVQVKRAPANCAKHDYFSWHARTTRIVAPPVTVTGPPDGQSTLPPSYSGLRPVIA